MVETLVAGSQSFPEISDADYLSRWHVIKLDFLGKYQEALTPQSFSIFNILPVPDYPWCAPTNSLVIIKVEDLHSFSFLTL